VTAVNPNEGQVALPYSRADVGYVVGRLGARAMRWVEVELGRTIDDVWTGFVRKVQAAHLAVEGGAAPDGGVTLPVAATSTVIWAGIEHERRLSKAAGPEFTMDDADAIVDEVGLDNATGYALALIQLSMPFKKRTDALREAAAAAGADDPVGPLMAAAIAATLPEGGTGTPTSTPPSTPDLPLPPPGS